MNWSQIYVTRTFTMANRIRALFDRVPTLNERFSNVGCFQPLNRALYRDEVGHVDIQCVLEEHSRVLSNPNETDANQTNHAE